MGKDTENRRTLVILGQTGLLGQALYKEASSRDNINVYGVARNGAQDSLDVTDTDNLIAYLDKVRPSYIVNTVAQVNLEGCEKDPDFAYELNAKVNDHLASYCTKNDIKLCYISTDHYFTGDGAALHDESACVTFLNEYSKTKYAGEEFVLTCPNSLVVRTNIVGFRNWELRPTFVEWAIDSLILEKDITAFHDFYTSSIDVRTCSKAILDLLFLDATGIINVASSECASKEEFIVRLARELDLDTPNLQSASVMTMGLNVRRAESLGLDVSYAESLLGYRLPSLEGVIDNIVHEYKQNNDLKLK